MNATNRASRRLAGLALAVLAAGLPACNGTRPWARENFGRSRRIAYKPIATSLRGRAFYVSGYGGADYSPSRPRRRPPAGGAPSYGYGMAAPAGTIPPAVSVRQGSWDEP